MATPDSIDCEHRAICHFPGILRILFSIADAEQQFLSPMNATVVRLGCGYDAETVAREHICLGQGLRT